MKSKRENSPPDLAHSTRFHDSREMGSALAMGFATRQPDYQRLADEYSQSSAQDSAMQMYQLARVAYDSAEASLVNAYREQSDEYSADVNVASLQDRNGSNTMVSAGQAYHSEVLLVGAAARGMGSQSLDQGELFRYYKTNAAGRGQTVIYTERIPCGGGGGIGGRGCLRSLEDALLDTDRVYYSFNSTEELDAALEIPRWEAAHRADFEAQAELEEEERQEQLAAAGGDAYDPYDSAAAREFFDGMTEAEMEQYEIDREEERDRVNDQFD